MQMHKRISFIKVFFILLFSFLTLHFSFAESSHSLIFSASTLPEAKLEYAYNYKLPFLTGNNPLTEGNNLNFNLSAGITPVTFDGVASVILTPIAFLEFSLGTRIGTGWTINLFETDIHGLAITKKSEENTGELEIGTQGGLYSKGFAAGAFQFDLAAVVPGDWNHVLFRTYHELNYANNSNASKNQSWKFEDDDGENINGFNYYANVVIGYQMPIILNMVAFMAEADLNLYDIKNKNDWGGNLAQWHFSGILNFEFNEKFNLAVITQFRTRKNYDKKIKDYYYQTLTVDNNNPLKIEFFRVAAIAVYKLK